MDDSVKALLDEGRAGEGPIVVLTGAGISAESGIPTFRGEEGYWTVGSRNFHPEDMATMAAFRRMPEEVWRWYLYRRSVCRAAQPNAAHRALVSLEAALGDRFLLLTQNVDGLHLRAGSSPERTYQVHGNIDFLRCPAEYPHVRPLPLEIGEAWTRQSPFTAEARRLLSCCPDGTLARPHVLWFDESYDEPLFRFESSLAAAFTASLLVVVGTSGSTNLPMHVARIVAQRRAPMIVLDPDPGVIGDLALASGRGAAIAGTAGAHLPEMIGRLIDGA